MKIALLGKGKTGHHFKTLAESRNDISVTVFDRNHPPDADRLAGHDVVVSFFPGIAFARYIPELIDSGLPVVTGSTGFDWPGGRDAFSESLAEKGLTWIHGNNFSPGMTLVRSMIGILRNAGILFDEYSFDLHEVHHTAKLDAPSGTALAWKDWTGEPVSITSERTGDVTGIHTLTLRTPFENISITHEVLDRALFASGAMRAVDILMSGVRDDFMVEVEAEVERGSGNGSDDKTETETEAEAEAEAETETDTDTTNGLGPGLHDFQGIVTQWLKMESGIGDYNVPDSKKRLTKRDGNDNPGSSITSTDKDVRPAVKIRRQSGNGSG